MIDASVHDSNTSFPKARIKVLLLENIHATAHELVTQQGLSLETMRSAMTEDELISKIPDVHVLGIRSKTHVTERVLQAARKLLAIGCYCIGTNQVDLAAAKRGGVPVFNAPFSNTRSVAELVLAELIGLSRQLFDRTREMHSGQWRKVSTNSFEVRGKTLGIIGYGHIGMQVGILAESIGMNVLFYDIAPRLPMGNNRPVESLSDLLRQSDFVTLHVPATPQTKSMFGAAEFHAMKSGAYFLNLSRGSVVDVEALTQSLQARHLFGAAIDVFPEEPEGNTDEFVSTLQKLPNVVLTPHVGGSTEEAQASIGREVTQTVIKYVNAGATTGAVNFPQIDPPELRNRHRILNVHQNVPGVLSTINRIVSDVQANIESQTLVTDPDVGYLVMDLNKEVSDEVKHLVSKLPTSIKTRVLY